MRFENSPKGIIKTKSININNQEVELQIKSDKIYYLKSPDNKIHKFKKVKFNEMNDYFFVRLEHKGFNDLLSFPIYNYPDFNNILYRLAKIAEIIYGVLFLTYPLTKMILPINSEIKTYYGTINVYGYFHNSLNISRFVLYLICLIIILFFIFKRIYIGGFSKIIFIKISLMLSFIFIIENFIYFILSGLATTFGMLSIINYIDKLYETMLVIKLFFHAIFNFISFWVHLGLFVHSIKLCLEINKIKTQINDLNNNLPGDNILSEIRFQYAGLDMNNYTLNELEIHGHPKRTYYTLNNVINIQIQNNQIDLLNTQFNKNNNSSSLQILNNSNKLQNNQNLVNNLNYEKNNEEKI